MQELFSSVWALEKSFYKHAYPVVLKRVLSGEGFENMGIINYRKKHHLKATLSDAENGIKDYESYLYYINESGKRVTQYNTENLTDNSMAVIEIMDVVTKWGGMCSYGTKEYIDSINSALNNDKVKCIVLHLDTPGGTVDGTEELADIIYEAKKQKPVLGIVDGLCASAGYWIGSQCTELWAMSEITSWIGSIGVLTRHIDQSGWLEQMGLTLTYIVASKSTDKIQAPDNEPLSDEAKQEITDELDTIHDLFISSVERGRGSKLSQGKENIFTGKCYNGKLALKYGMIDGIGSFQKALTRAKYLYKIQ